MQTRRRRPRPSSSQPPHEPEVRATAIPRSEPRVRAVPRRVSTPVPQAPRAYVATDDLHLQEYQPNQANYLENVRNIKAMTVFEANPARGRTLAEARGYDSEDLFVVAEIAHNYLMSGGTELAQTLFEGLAAVDPDEPYFALALGLTYDHLGDPRTAMGWYEKAAKLDPSDGRPDINRAELYIVARDFERARRYLARGANKAKQRGDQALAQKAVAVLAHLGRTAPPQRSHR